MFPRRMVKTTSGRKSPPKRRPRPLGQIPTRDAVFRPKPQHKPKNPDYPTLKPRSRKASRNAVVRS